MQFICCCASVVLLVAGCTSKNTSTSDASVSNDASPMASNDASLPTGFCALNHESCGDVQCCSGICSNGACACTDNGNCTTGNECCSGICLTGVCGPCNGGGSLCHMNANCCSGSCLDGVCRPQLVNGTYYLSSVTPIADGCQINLPNNFAMPVMADRKGNVSLGKLLGPSDNPSFTPAGYQFGSGQFNDALHATTAVTARVTVQPCSFDLTRTLNITAIDDRHLSVEMTSTGSNGVGCAWGATCMSSFTFRMGF
jgi:hypothetical protein